MHVSENQSKEFSNLKCKVCERLKSARIENGFATAKHFAELSGLKISTYTLHEAGTRSMSFEVLEHYSQLLQVNLNWILTGVGPKSSSKVRHVPIIQWNEIATFSPSKDKQIHTKNWTTSDVDLSAHSFALIVENDAMEPRYPENTIIIVDCQQKPKNKDFALLLIKENKSAIFKQIVLVEGEIFAKSLNPDYKAFRLTKGMTILGKIVQAKLVC